MADQQVMTLDNPAGLLLTPEILQKIGVGAGDQIEISVNDRTLTVRPLNEAETERKMDEIAASLLERRRSLYERLAEGAK